ncbi:IclR family transcriptional regulator [Arthrobacter ruber]|uniref:IclR family transcriptional regulator n=1 Tax=Arthrobacter ruber TaxID=1258893 RepID=UPI000CF53BA8|nr:IclR family transcriptional regulator [Arthrobacter ruber]
MTEPEGRDQPFNATGEGIRSVERAAAVVDAISRAGSGGLRLVDIAAQTNLSKTTAHRLLGTLTKVGWVDQDDAGTFFLGLPLVGYGTSASDRHGLLDIAEPHLSRLAELTGDTVYLSVLLGDKAFCIDQATGSFPIRTLNPRVGDRLRLGTCAGSLALLSWLDDNEAERIFREDITATNSSGLEVTIVRQLVDQTRQNGHAYFPGLLVPGSAGLGVPVFDAQDKPIASLSVASIESRMDEPRRSQIVAWLHEEAERLANKLLTLDPHLNQNTLRRLTLSS